MTDHSRSLTRAFVTSAVGHSLVRERLDPFIISREAVVALQAEAFDRFCKGIEFQPRPRSQVAEEFKSKEPPEPH